MNGISNKMQMTIACPFLMDTKVGGAVSAERGSASKSLPYIKKRQPTGNLVDLKGTFFFTRHTKFINIKKFLCGLRKRQKITDTDNVHFRKIFKHFISLVQQQGKTMKNVDIQKLKKRMFYI